MLILEQFSPVLHKDICIALDMRGYWVTVFLTSSQKKQKNKQTYVVGTHYKLLFYKKENKTCCGYSLQASFLQKRKQNMLWVVITELRMSSTTNVVEN